MIQKEPLKVRMHRRDIMYGCFVGSPSPAVVEMVGYAGFDYAIIDLEHGAIGLETLEHMLRAADAAGLSSLVRLPGPYQSDILRVLDAGAEGILVPGVNDVEQARQVVGYAYYAPFGQRGISTVSRAAHHAVSDPQSYLAQAANRTVVMLMIESATAMHNLEGIAGTKGIDGLFVGPNDLASVLGHVGDRNHPEVQTAIKDIVERARKSDCALATLARSASDVTAVPDQGFNMVTFNTTFVLASGLKDIMRAVGDSRGS